MSRREDRDSGSRRHHSRFDREPSPKRSKRDGKAVTDRVTNGPKMGVGDHKDGDQKHYHRSNDAPTLLAPSADDLKPESRTMNKENDKKSNDHYQGSKHSSDSIDMPRSRSYYQHDERGSVGQTGRSYGRRATGERGWWKDSREQQNGRVDTGREQRDEKSQTKLDNDSLLCGNDVLEQKDDPPPMRKRPAFRENKIPVDPGNVEVAAIETTKSSHPDHLVERSERRDGRGSNTRHLDRSNERREEKGSRSWLSDRPEKQFAGDEAPNRGEVRRDGFSSRGRYNSGSYRRDIFNGRPPYRPTGTRVEKWKHDLYQEVNMDPIPKNDEDQIAKLEALLAS